MYNNRMFITFLSGYSDAHHAIGSHPLLAQIPLTVSPFISLPTATTLPYTYKPLPSTLPPSCTADSTGSERAKYVVARSGHAASPEEIVAACNALQEHIQKAQEDAEQKVKDWEKSIKDQELAEKRRVAPGWLDREEKILEPSRASIIGMPAHNESRGQNDNIMDAQNEDPLPHGQVATASSDLDRAFGGMSLEPR